jgi:hypothetical protein
MGMMEARIGDQLIRYDRESTLAIYRSIENGDADVCGCVCCQNFAAQRNSAYPASFRTVLDQLGIDPVKEGEVYAFGPKADGTFDYGGWLYFGGEMVEAGERNVSAFDTEHFEFFFTAHCPAAPAFPGRPLRAVEFTTTLNWVLPNRLE